MEMKMKALIGMISLFIGSFAIAQQVAAPPPAPSNPTKAKPEICAKCIPEANTSATGIKNGDETADADDSSDAAPVNAKSGT